MTSQRGKPQSIRVDNGPEFISQSLDLWAYFNGVKLDISRPGKPADKAVIESFNGRLRDECLNQHWFLSLDEARAVPHGVEGGLQSRPSAWCSGQPNTVVVRAAGSWACPATGPAWLTTRLVPSWGQRQRLPGRCLTPRPATVPIVDPIPRLKAVMPGIWPARRHILDELIIGGSDTLPVRLPTSSASRNQLRSGVEEMTAA